MTPKPQPNETTTGDTKAKDPATRGKAPASAKIAPKEQKNRGVENWALPEPGYKQVTLPLKQINPFLERIEAMYPFGGVYKPSPKPQLQFI